MIGLPTKIFDADVGVIINFVILQADGLTPQDLNDATVSLYIEGLTNPFTPVVIDEEAAGRCHYVIAAGDLPYGVYRAQLRIFFNSDNDFRSEIFSLNASQSIS